MKKNKAVEKTINKLKRICRNSINKQNYNVALSCISVASFILYDFNQSYYDEFLEDAILEISDFYKKNYSFNEYSQNDCSLFYDGFCFRTRGIATQYINGLIKNGQKVIYVSNDYGDYVDYLKDKFGNNIIVEIVTKNNEKLNYDDRAKLIADIIYKYKPKNMFFYAMPNDSAGCVAFAIFKNYSNRYLIDLTDHAFWLGVKCNDYFIGCRDLSASNLIYNRMVDKNRFIKNEVYLVYDSFVSNESTQPLPFDIYKENYIFSGGSLYKTLGDKDNTFYRIIDHVLDKFPNYKFLYAGSGDRKVMDELIISKYPDRAFLINERSDFPTLLKYSKAFINTYPVCGGLMTKFAADSGVIPLTIELKPDTDEILLDQERAKIIYKSYEELIGDLDILLSNDNYRKEREALLLQSVVSEERFVHNLESILCGKQTDFTVSFDYIDTSVFISAYYKRFSLFKTKMEIANKSNLPLLKYFPSLTMAYVFKFLLKKILRINK